MEDLELLGGDPLYTIAENIKKIEADFKILIQSIQKSK